MDIELYGTTFCHLCEEAEAILHKIGIEAAHIDIAEDDELLEKYGVRIPVLKRVDTGAELGWPFDAETVSCFLAL
jgi:glutaredoxin